MLLGVRKNSNSFLKDGSSDVQIKEQMESIKELLKTVNLWESAKKKLAPGALQFFQSRV